VSAERLSNLFFELSNENRLEILWLIQENPHRLTQISRKLAVTVQEASRHLSRLAEGKLIHKSSDGLFHLTSYGRYVINQLSGLQVLLQHREYFASHDLSSIPSEFVDRIGELKGCSFTDDIMLAFSLAENLIGQAQDYIWIMGNQVLMSTLPLLEAAVKRGAAFRLILPEALTPPPGFKPLPTTPRLVERRTLPHVDVFMTISEKEARVGFLAADGKLDPSAFGSKDLAAHKWCRDLYLHYWEKAEVGQPRGYPTPSAP